MSKSSLTTICADLAQAQARLQAIAIALRLLRQPGLLNGWAAQTEQAILAYIEQRVEERRCADAMAGFNAANERIAA